MTAIRALMSHIVDYAGLFPPAALAMETTVRNFSAYRTGPHAWMLGRLICPTARMKEFAEVYSALEDAERGPAPWHLSALGRGGDDGYGFMANLDEDLADIRDLSDRFSGRLVVDAFECRVPTMLVGASDGKDLRELANQATRKLHECAPGSVATFFEIPFVGDWRQNVVAAVAAIARHNAEMPAGQPASGVKIRMGGVKAEMFPSAEQVACFIDACRRCRVAFKATAGLHHPIRHYAGSVETKMHGFVNVFGGSALVRAADGDGTLLCRLLDDESARSFALADDALMWGELRATAEQIAAARRDLATSFGSCSFTEPIEDLEALGWL